jgi:hypothetical protein
VSAASRAERRALQRLHGRYGALLLRTQSAPVELCSTERYAICDGRRLLAGRTPEAAGSETGWYEERAPVTGAAMIAARWPLALAICEGLGLRGAALAAAAEAEVASLIEEAR